MDVAAIIKELREQRDAVTMALASMKRLAVVGQGKRRGRPPKWMKQLDYAKTEAPNRGRPPKSKEPGA